MAVPVSCSPAFPFHVAAALSSLTAGWIGMEIDPFESWVDSPLVEGTANSSRLVVMRSRSRSLVVPSTADTVPSAALAKRSTWPLPRGTTPAGMPAQTSRRAAEVFLSAPDHQFNARLPQPPQPERPKAIKWWQFFSLIWNWIRSRVREIAVDAVRRKIEQAKDSLEDRVQKLVLGENSALRLDRRGRHTGDIDEFEEYDLATRIQQIGGEDLLLRSQGMDPSIWPALREWSFGLIDGGQLPPEAVSLLTDGTKRIVLTDPSFVVPVPEDTGWWTPPVAVARELGGAAGALRACDVLAANSIEQYLRELHSKVLADEQESEANSTATAAPSSVLLPPPPTLIADLPAPPPPVGAPIPAPDGTPPPPENIASADSGPVATDQVVVESGPEVSADTVRSELGRRASAVEIEEALASLRAAQLGRVDTFHWQVGTRLAQSIGVATSAFDWCVEQINNPPGEEFEKNAARERKRLKRKVIFSILRTIGFLVLGVLAFVFLPLTMLILAAILAISVVSAIVNLVLGVIKYFRAHLQAEFEMTDVIGKFEFACTAIPAVIAELGRLHSLYRQFLDWSEVIGAVAHRPFGPPMVYSGRTHGNWVGGLYAHQVGEGEISADNMAALVSSQAKEVFQPAWLQSLFDDASDRILSRYQFMTTSDASDSDPDIDNKVLGAGDALVERSPRRFLLQMVKEGKALGEGRLLRMDEILGRLSELPPGRLCDSVDGADPELWLGDAVPKETAAPFPRGLWVGRRLNDPPSVSHRVVWVPSGLSAESTVDVKVLPMSSNRRTLASTIVCVDLSTLVEVDPAAPEITIFGSHPTPPVNRVPIPPTVVLGGPRELVAFAGTGPDQGLLPIPGSIISPAGTPERPASGGTFSYIFMVDGQPCRYPVGAPVNYRLRLDAGPTEGFALVKDALQLMANVSGIEFRFDGTFYEMSEVDFEKRCLWIAFVNPEDGDRGGTQGLGDMVLGLGGPVVRGRDIIGGSVRIGNDPTVKPGFGPGHTLGGVLLHELGHALNLDHVDVQTELMFPCVTELSPDGFGPGDRMGLWLLGAGRGPF
jgi:hypothetical protein